MNANEHKLFEYCSCFTFPYTRDLAVIFTISCMGRVRTENHSYSITSEIACAQSLN
jgi:hypothetical protein